MRLITVSIVGFLMIAVGLTGCGGGDDEEPSAQTGTETAVGGTQETGGEPFRVAVLSPGTQNDLNWGQGWFEGIQEAKQEYNVEVEFADNLNEVDPYLQLGSAFAAEGTDLIIMTLTSAIDAVQQLAPEFPDTTFCILLEDAELLQSLPDNVCFFDVEQQDPSFLAGALAGLVTRSDKIAAISGFEFPGLTRQPEAFHLGARCVNPDVEFSNEYLNSWTDTSLAKSAAEAMIAQGADVLFAATAGAEVGVYEAASNAPGTSVIAPYFDANERAPGAILTSVLYDLQGVAKELIRAGVEGDIGARSFFRFDMAELSEAGLAPLYEAEEAVGEDVLGEVSEIRERIVAGEIKVPGEQVIGKTGAAANIDPDSIGC